MWQSHITQMLADQTRTSCVRLADSFLKPDKGMGTCYAEITFFYDHEKALHFTSLGDARHLIIAPKAARTKFRVLQEKQNKVWIPESARKLPKSPVRGGTKELGCLPPPNSTSRLVSSFKLAVPRLTPKKA